MATVDALDKARFAAAEMDLALWLALRAPNDFLSRAIARHVIVRALDFVGLAFEAAAELRRRGHNVDDARNRLATFRDQFEEYYAKTRTKLGAHVQSVQFSERLELWTEIEVSKLSFFVDGAKEVHDALALLVPSIHAPIVSFPEQGDPVLEARLREAAERGRDDGAVRIGADVLSATRPNTVSVLNLTPVHQRAGELAAIDEWIEGQYALLAVVDGYVNAARIFRARLVTDIVSFVDCLVTRVDGDPAHRYPGLEELLADQGDASAITQFRAVYRFDEKLRELRIVRNRYGAHLDRDATRDLISLLAEIDAVDLPAAMRFYDRTRSVFHVTCQRTHFLNSYRANGVRLAGVMGTSPGSNHHVIPFAPVSSPKTVTDSGGEFSTVGFDVAGALDAWIAGGESAAKARSFLWDAFLQGPVRERIRREAGEHLVRYVELREAHLLYRARLQEEREPRRVARLAALAEECARGSPEPLAQILTEYIDATAVDDEEVLLALVSALGALPLRDGEWLRTVIARLCAHPAALVAAAAVAALYRSALFEDRSLEASTAETYFTRVIVPILRDGLAERQLLALLIIASRFGAGRSGAHGDTLAREDGDVLFATWLTFVAVTGNSALAGQHWRRLADGRDCIGAAVLVAEELDKHSREKGRCFAMAVATDLILPSGVPWARSQSLANRAAALVAVGRNQEALELALEVRRADPLDVEMQLALIPLFVEAGMPCPQARAMLDELIENYTVDHPLASALERARRATNEERDG